VVRATKKQAHLIVKRACMTILVDHAFRRGQ
jgi:hypothetical protein